MSLQNGLDQLRLAAIVAGRDVVATRRRLLLASLMAGLPLAAWSTTAQASPIELRSIGHGRDQA
jgi:hypothetical protein